MSEAPWDALVLTCQNRNSAHAFQKELEIRQQKGLIHKDVLILTIEDPKCRVGSGGATINALLLVAEHLSAKMGYSVVNPNVFLNVRIVVMHMGRNFPFDACGRTFTTLPMSCQSNSGYAAGLLSNIDNLMDILAKYVTVGAPPGVWVCSTDMFLDIPGRVDIEWSKDHDVLSLSVPVSIDVACQHGIYVINDQGYIERAIYKGDPDTIKPYARPDGKFNLVLGVVYFSPQVVEIMLSFHAIPPLNGCTYYGLDSGAPSIEFSIFFDLLVPMFTGTQEEDFVGRQRLLMRSSSYTGSHSKLVSSTTQTLMNNARAILWQCLHRFRAKAVLVNEGMFNYLSLSCQDYMNYIIRMAAPDESSSSVEVHSIAEGDVTLGSRSVSLNCFYGNQSTVGDQSIVSHCSFPGGTKIGQECLVSGVRQEDGLALNGFDYVHVNNRIVVQGFNMSVKTPIHTTQQVYMVAGKYDNLEVPVSDKSATFCNVSWDTFFKRTGIQATDLWPNAMKDGSRCILNAKLYPVIHASTLVGLRDVLWLQQENVDPGSLERWKSSWRLSMQDIMMQCDLSMEFQKRRHLFFKIGKIQIKDTLMNKKGMGLMPLYRSASIEGYAEDVLALLDKVIYKSSDPGIAARTMGNIADMLDCMSCGRGGLRSGPAGNREWEHALTLIKNKDVRAGVEELAKARSNWLSRPDHLMRAARHYEGAGQIFIKQAVETATKTLSYNSQFITPKSGADKPAMGKWVQGESPARIDMAGGWSDTPPMTYEHGGAVVNVAVLVNGQKPIGAKARIIKELKIVLVMLSENSKDTIVELHNLSDCEDYCCPQAPGALLKAAVIAAEIIRLESTQTLVEQLEANFGGGLEIHTWARLPHGSGLGTSSILAGVVMSVLWRVCGMTYTETDLMHSVLHVEQLLTTGGGWQDQVGGLVPSVKMGHSSAGLPLKVEIDHINVSKEMVEKFNSRLLLLYTGKTRLAKNLLQNAVRAWYGRDPEIVKTMDGLVQCAHQCKKAFSQGDIEKVGDCFRQYWSLKKRMAVGSEPAAVTSIISLLDAHTMAACMAGAGGGGFLYLLTKEPNMKDTISKIVSSAKDGQGMILYDAEIDLEGLSITVNE